MKLQTNFKFLISENKIYAGAYQVGSLNKGEPKIFLNMEAVIEAISDENEKSELFKDFILQLATHEFAHAMQEWLGKEYDEEEVEKIVESYNEKWKQSEQQSEQQQLPQVFVINDMLRFLDNSQAKTVEELKKELHDLFYPEIVLQDRETSDIDENADIVYLKSIFPQGYHFEINASLETALYHYKPMVNTANNCIPKQEWYNIMSGMKKYFGRRLKGIAFTEHENNSEGFIQISRSFETVFPKSSGDEKPLIRIADTQFAHGTSLGSGDLKIYPTHFNWYRGPDKISNMIVITESMFSQVDSYTEDIKIAWLLEPRSISPDSYAWIEQNWNRFDYILTHNVELINYIEKTLELFSAVSCNFPRLKKIIWYPFGGCWIEQKDRGLHQKTKKVSIIVSWKKETEGQKLRHEVISRFGDRMDVYGNGYKKVENKIEALRDYQFSIIIENEKSDYWFTEKLIDCLVTGTIPIFWGSSKVAENFNVIQFRDLDELGVILDRIDNNESFLKDYQKHFNKSKAEKYAITEDQLYDIFGANNLLGNLIKM